MSDKGGGWPEYIWEQYLRDVLVTIREGVAFSDEAGRFYIYNAAMEQLTGYSMEEANASRDFMDLIYRDPEHRQKAREGLAELIKNGRFHKTEARITAKTGAAKDVIISSALIVREGQKYFLSIYLDISERKQFERALRQSERKLRAIFDQAFQFVGLMTVEGVLVDANRTALEFSGYEAHDVLGKPFWDTPWWIHSPALQDKLKQAVHSAARGECVRFEATHIDKHGALHYVDFSLRPVTDESGKVIFLIPEGRDITERKKMETAMERLAAIVEHSDDAIIGRDLGGTITSWNNAATKMYGYSRDEATGSNISIIVPPDRVFEMAGVNKKLMRGEAVARFETKRLKKDGTLIDVSLTVSPVKDGDGKITGFATIFHNITLRKKTEMALRDAYAKLKRAQDQLIQAEKMEAVGTLASGVAHEVKNPLGIILQSVNYLEDKFPKGRKDIAQVLRVTKDNIKRADDIVRSLLEFSKAEALDISPADINAILNKSVSLMRYHVKQEGVKIVKEFDGGLPLALVDKGKMEQVFINILINAFQAMPGGGKLFLRSSVIRMVTTEWERCSQESKYFMSGEEAVAVEIEDTGTGIPGKIMGKIFDPFFTTKGARGSGLGLSVTRSLLDMQNACIKITSVEGKGTKVIIAMKISKGGLNG